MGLDRKRKEFCNGKLLLGFDFDLLRLKTGSDSSPSLSQLGSALPLLRFTFNSDSNLFIARVRSGGMKFLFEPAVGLSLVSELNQVCYNTADLLLFIGDGV